MRSTARGQALPLVMLLGTLLGIGALSVGALGWVHVARARAQTAADAAALSAGRLLALRLTEIANARPARQRRAFAEFEHEARDAARASGGEVERVWNPDTRTWPPTRVEVRTVVRGPFGLRVPAVARAALMIGTTLDRDTAWVTGGGGYHGPLVTRDGKPMCPAVGAAFDAMDAAAHRDGVDLVVTSGYRTDAEQAILFAAHPDPKWVARPGTSRHRDATELDISMGGGPAWSWLAANAVRFGFRQRYSWEPWHYGYLPGCGPGAAPEGPPREGLLPSWVPAQYRAIVAGAATQAGVPPILLAALLQSESGFSPRAVSPVGALGIAQFMPGTAAAVGLANPFDPAQAIPAAAKLLGAHLREFGGSVPLALAAYNAGPGAVRRYRGVPPFAETRAYVARITALAGGADLLVPSGEAVVLVAADDGANRQA